jgi:hypothetical protein
MTIFTYSHLISLNLSFVSLCLEKQPKAGVASVCPNLVNDLLKKIGKFSLVLAYSGANTNKVEEIKTAQSLVSD